MIKISTPEDRFYLAFWLFVISELFLPSFLVWELLFYLLLVPSMVPVLRSLPSRNLLSGTVLSILLLHAYFVASLAWASDWEWAVAGRWVWRTLITLAFITAATMFCLLQDRRAINRFLDTTIIAVVVAGLISIVVHVGFGEAGERMRPLGQNDFPISGASVYGFYGILALCRYHDPSNNGRRLLYAAAVIVAATVILLTISRGPMLAFALTTVFVLIAFRNWKGIAVAASAAALLVILTEILRGLDLGQVTAGAQTDLVPYFVARGIYLRPAIWDFALQQIGERILLGHGLSASFEFTDPVRIAHPHSLYVSTLYYGGIVGLALLLAMLARLVLEVRVAWPGRYAIMMAALLLHGLLSGLTDLSRLATSLSPFWIFFWFPVAIVAGFGLRKRLGWLNELDHDSDPLSK